MAYSNTHIKGRIGYTLAGWPLIIIERAKSDKPDTPVLCEVFGDYHESGSVYHREIRLSHSQDYWEEQVIAHGFKPSNRYFKGPLLTKGNG